LTGANNYIDVGNGGFLELYQNIAVQGQQNNRGGIAFGPAHNGTLAVQVESGGTLSRSDVPFPGVPDQVSIAGAVYNLGGITNVLLGSMLNITGKDATNYSYWQKTGATGQLQVDAGSNLNAIGSYQIDIGLVQLTAPNGKAADELDSSGAGLVFANVNNTNLTIVDAGAGTGTVTIQGPVTMAAKTTTTLNCFGGNNTADLLDVQKGPLTLAGTLKLNIVDSIRPAQALTFFDDTGGTPVLGGAFATFTDTLGDKNDTGQVGNGANGLIYQVTFKQ
jgi:hypothetical protein